MAALLPLAACSTHGEAAPAPSSLGPTMASPSACQVRYVVRAQPAGFTADVSVTNLGSAIGAYRVDFELGSADQKLASGWGASWAQSGTRLSASVTTGGLGGNAPAVLGFDGTGPAGTAPKSFKLNGVACSLRVDSNTSVPAKDGGAPALHVSGNRIVDDSGTPVDLIGVNRAGGEFQCVQRGGIWDGPVDDESLDAMQSWQVHAVRLPLNEDCWLGGGAGKPSTSGAVYRNAVAVLVARLEAHRLTPILDLHWTDGAWTGRESQCGSALATCQKPVPDSRAIDFWRSVGQTFGSDQAVAFDLFNEPYPGDIGVVSKTQSWDCWLNGNSACGEIGYDVAGMQQMLDAVRSTGAHNVVLVSGSSWARDLTGWLAHEPKDPVGNLVASWHWYDDGSCMNEGCWQREVAPVAARVPVLVSEIGEKDCASTSVDPLMTWLDQHDIGYLAWTWNTWDCGDGPALIKDYSGAPTAYGQGVMEHFRSRAGGTGNGGA
jgi:endoglucanase